MSCIPFEVPCINITKEVALPRVVFTVIFCHVLCLANYYNLEDLKNKRANAQSTFPVLPPATYATKVGEIISTCAIGKS